VGEGGGTGTAKVVTEGADSLTIEAQTNGPSVLLVSRTFHPSWKADVNGAATDVVRVDHALIGVPLSTAGTHRVTLAYRPRIVAQAKLVTTATWIVVLMASLVSVGLSLREKQRRV
jgi:hypothetical protein